MPTVAELRAAGMKPKVLMLAMGFPSAGKTGSLACLANAGYPVYFHDFDHNIAPLLTYLTPVGEKNLHLYQFSDRMWGDKKRVATSGAPEAFSNYIDLLQRGEYRAPGEDPIKDLPSAYDLGPDDIIVTDSLTGLSDAIMRRELYLSGRIEKGPRERDWLNAMNDVRGILEILSSPRIKCNVIMTAHLKIIGPKEPRDTDKDEVADWKKQMGDLIPSRYFPNSLGRALPPEIARHFDCCVLVDVDAHKSGSKRVIRTAPRPDMDLCVAGDDIPKSLPQADGMLTLFRLLRGEASE